MPRIGLDRWNRALQTSVTRAEAQNLDAREVAEVPAVASLESLQAGRAEALSRR
jgi:hypothetical protein